MKQSIFLELLEGIKQKPRLLRRLKIFAVVGIVGFLITGALAIWAGVAAINYMASTVNQVATSSLTQGQLEKLKTGLNGLPQLQAVSCWNKAQSLMAVQPWLERPALDNFAKLKTACLEAKKPECEEAPCNKALDLVNTAEGNII